jgi:hypothetical protein
MNAPINTFDNLGDTARRFNALIDGNHEELAITTGKQILAQSGIDELAEIIGEYINKILPCGECSIIGSNLSAHLNLKGDIRSFNDRKQFIFHTNGSSPWVIIDLSKVVPSGEDIYLYNRCHSSEISERIMGCRLYVSSDANNWEEKSLELDDDQIYNHKGIKISNNQSIRFIKLERPLGDTPIHLSQITLGKPLARIHEALRILNIIIGTYYQMDISECGRIIESLSWNCYTEFKASCLENELSISIRNPGRFSNLVIEVSHAIHFAHKVGIKNVYIPEHERTRNLLPDSHIINCRNLPVTIKIGNPKGISLMGSYFHTRQQGSIYSDFPGLRNMVQEFKHACNFISASDNDSGRILTIHIRSGDVFKTNIHKGYGQPPLAFFLKAISHYDPEGIILVFEDLANPVIAALKARIVELEIPFSVQSSSALREDISTLVNATALVISHGTFAHGVLCFSDKIQRLYNFHFSLRAGVLPAKNPPVSQFCIRDSRGEYIKNVMSGNWENSIRQRELMLQYPERHLEITDKTMAY